MLRSSFFLDKFHYYYGEIRADFKECPSPPEFSRDYVVKYLKDGECLSLELVRHQEAYQLARSTRQFRVPKVIEHDALANSITFERIGGLCHLHDERFGSDETKRLLVRAARTLATIHNLQHSDGLRKILYRKSKHLVLSPNVVHGDFAINNIEYNPSNDELVIFDWSLAAWVLPVPLHYLPYLDLCNLINSIFIRRILAKPKIRKAEENAEAVFVSYLESFEGDFDVKIFAECFAKFSSSYVKFFFKMPKRERRNYFLRFIYRAAYITSRLPSVMTARSFVVELAANVTTGRP